MLLTQEIYERQVRSISYIANHMRNRLVKPEYNFESQLTIIYVS